MSGSIHVKLSSLNYDGYLGFPDRTIGQDVSKRSGHAQQARFSAGSDLANDIIQMVGTKLIKKCMD